MGICFRACAVHYSATLRVSSAICTGIGFTGAGSTLGPTQRIETFLRRVSVAQPEPFSVAPYIPARILQRVRESVNLIGLYWASLSSFGSQFGIRSVIASQVRK